MENRGCLGHCCELLRLSLFLLAQGLNSRLWSTSGHWCPFLGRRAIKCQRSPTSFVYAFMGCLARIARSLLTPMKTKEVTSSPLTTMETVSLIIFQEYDETGQAKRVKIRLTSRSDQATQHSPQKLNLAPTPSKLIGQGCTICIRRQSSPNKVAPSIGNAHIYCHPMRVHMMNPVPTEKDKKLPAFIFARVLVNMCRLSMEKSHKG